MSPDRNVRWKRVQQRGSIKGRVITSVVVLIAAAVGAMLYAQARAERIELELEDLAGWAVYTPAERKARIAERCKEASGARIDSLLARHRQWDDRALAHVACKRVVAGMSETQVRAAWGEPTGIQPNIDRYRPGELWFYGPSLTVLMWDGRVKSTQEF